MVWGGVAILCIIFSIIIGFSILDNTEASAQTSPFVKLDQKKIVIDHSDVITLYDPNVSDPSVIVSVDSKDVTGTSLQGYPKTITLLEIGPNLYRKMIKFSATPGPDDVRVVDGGRVEVSHGSKSSGDITVTTGSGTQAYGARRDDTNYANCSSLGGDTDKDGVCDSWESDTSKLTINYPTGGTYTTQCLESEGFLDDKFNIFTKCSGTDMRDIYVEIDYMIGHRPNEEALKEVVQAFYNAPAFSSDPNKPGIRLHIQIDDNNYQSIYHKKSGNNPPFDICTTFPGMPFGQQRGFDQLKGKYFATDATWKQKKQVFHYALFVHNQCTGNISGSAELFGNDFIISLGPFDGSIGNPHQQAGTFMHELGHNLKLHHGGAVSDSINCKPNYLSVLSYSRQFPDLVSNRTLDYSRQSLGIGINANSINENAPIENQGITHYTENDANPNEKIIWGPTPPIPLPPTNSACVNWDLDSNECETSVGSMNLNLISSGGSNVCDGSGTSFSGYDDWENIDLNNKLSSYWSDGRSAGAGPKVAVWENGAVDSTKKMPSFFCPSLDQILSVVPKNATAEQINGHISNYRVCAGGVGVSDKKEIACAHYLAIAQSLALDPQSFIQNPTKFKNYNFSPIMITSCLDYFNNGTSVESVVLNSLLDKVNSEINIAETKKTFPSNLIMENEILNSFETIHHSHEITSDEVKILRLSRMDSIEKYVKSLNDSDFISGTDGKQKTVEYTEQKTLEIRTAINNNDMPLAASLIENLNYNDKIQNLTKLQFLNDAIIDTTISYTFAVPEFGEMVTLILVISMIAILLLFTKTKNLLPQGILKT